MIQTIFLLSHPLFPMGKRAEAANNIPEYLIIWTLFRLDGSSRWSNLTTKTTKLVTRLVRNVWMLGMRQLWPTGTNLGDPSYLVTFINSYPDGKRTIQKCNEIAIIKGIIEGSVWVSLKVLISFLRISLSIFIYAMSVGLIKVDLPKITETSIQGNCY